jgi:hypothetical protein
MKTVVLILLAAFAGAPAFGWDQAWTNGDQFAGYVIGNEASSAVVERATAAKLTNGPSTGDWWWASFFKQRSKCVNAKALLKAAIDNGVYLDMRLADVNGRWGDYLQTNNLLSAVWVASNLLTFAAVTNDYFDTTPWFGGALINGPYGFKPIRAIVTNLVSRRVALYGFAAGSTNVESSTIGEATWAAAVATVQGAWGSTNTLFGRHSGVVFYGYENAGDGSSWEAAASRDSSGYKTVGVDTNIQREEQFYFRAGPYFLSSLTNNPAWLFDNDGDSRIQTNFTLYSCNTSAVATVELRMSAGDLSVCPTACAEPAYSDSSSLGWQPAGEHSPSVFGNQTNFAWVVFRYNISGGFVYK